MRAAHTALRLQRLRKEIQTAATIFVGFPTHLLPSMTFAVQFERFSISANGAKLRARCKTLARSLHPIDIAASPA